ncbi:MAG TPA: cyclopropane-fatty-acyl-phospholipid synthase family protein, partial [Rubrobacter sp.]|nr:cyclopropane-fatty-acyl-phospholipid synthase family protein [Rubrobacter sp.]
FGAWARERSESRGGVQAREARFNALVEHKSTGPLAEVPEAANEQHYELPPGFLGLFLGPRRKYSGCLFEGEATTLAAAEEAMLALTCERAGIQDGQRILELGCGWGSLTLWLAERYPNAEIVAVSNANNQREFIQHQASERGFSKLTVVTQDMNDFEPAGTFDRVVSVEMFEHMRNWKELLRRISAWLEPGGKLFVHVFSHRTLPYLFEGTWAAERFFTGGVMPSHDLILRFQDDMTVTQSWIVPGTHYARTLKEWLANLDARRNEALAILRRDGRTEHEARALLGGWRLFLLSTGKVWGYRGGNRWLVSHYVLEPR